MAIELTNDPVIDRYIQTLAKVIPSDRRHQLEKTLPIIDSSKDLIRRRAFLCADRAVRVFAVIALRAGGHTEEADKLNKLEPIIDGVTAYAAYIAYAADAAYIAYAADAAYAAYIAYAADAAYAAANAETWDEAIKLLDDLVALGRVNNPFENLLLAITQL